ncbi:uncharacterized protein LOC143021958 [Oratosquilla oratoria]|uniref:uncharacterized protein LOC143021958 n=1 Tax=Oratosquilla oratoria TaxID=337810 RepID=UPI003F775AD7
MDHCHEIELYPDPTVIIVDFEQAIIQAISNVFGPETRTQGCFYHLTQSTWRKIQDLGLTNHYKESENFRHFCGQIDSLAFIPVEDAPAGMQLLTTRSYHSADCDTDHSLVGCKVRLQPKQIHRSKQTGYPRINTARTKMPDLCKRFADSTEEALRDCPTNSAEERWNHIRGAIYNSAMDTFGKRERQNPDWFEAGITKLELAIADKRKALLNYKREPSEKTLAALRKARNDAQRLARRSANDYWLSLCQSIQLSADCGNIRAMYDNMKKAFGPSITKIAPLKTASGDTITDRGKQMERWAEHYQELYSRENVVSTATVEKCKALPLMEELDVPPSIDELGKAIDSLASGKAPGNDGIPPDVVKAGKSTVLHHHLHELLLQCWEGTIPQGMRDANIITKETAATATTTAEYPFSVPLGRPSPE